MGRLMNDLMQKLLPASKRAIRIRMRRHNGTWEEFDLPPSQRKFRFKSDKKEYTLIGQPDIESSTNQREYMFLEDIPFPIVMDEKHPGMLAVGKQAEDQQMLLLGAERRGYQKALFLKSKKENDLLIWVLLAVGLNIIVTIGGLLMQAQMSGVKFW